MRYVRFLSSLTAVAFLSVLAHGVQLHHCLAAVGAGDQFRWSSPGGCTSGPASGDSGCGWECVLRYGTRDRIFCRADFGPRCREPDLSAVVVWLRLVDTGRHAWTLLDNFQWAEGYTERYGLIHTDFRNQKRTIKDSGLWYGRVAASNRLDV